MIIVVLKGKFLKLNTSNYICNSIIMHSIIVTDNGMIMNKLPNIVATIVTVVPRLSSALDV